MKKHSSSDDYGFTPVEESRKSQQIGDSPPIPPYIINEIQLLLAEKRTSLATLRTGIAVLVLPLSVTTFLIATSKYYHFERVLNLLIPIMALNAALMILGVYLVIRAFLRLHNQDSHIQKLKQKYRHLADLI